MSIEFTQFTGVFLSSNLKTDIRMRKSFAKLWPVVILLFSSFLLTAQEAPEFHVISVTSTVDSDSDGALENWKFSMDINAKGSGTAYGVYVNIKDDRGIIDETFGPYSVTGSSFEFIEMGDFSSAVYFSDPNVLPAASASVTFTLRVYNGFGDDVKTEIITADYQKVYSAPDINNVEIFDFEDKDGDGYYERWNLRYSGIPANGSEAIENTVSVSVDGFEIYNEFVSSFYYLMPFIALPDEFFGGSAYDNTPGNVDFVFYAENAFGNDSYVKTIPVDDWVDYASPIIESVAIVDGVDEDQDGYYEMFSLLIDVNAEYVDWIADDVEIYVEEPNILPLGETRGPFEFFSWDISDAQKIGPFTTEGATGLPAELDIYVKAENSLYFSETTITVPADEFISLEEPVIRSYTIVEGDDVNNNNYYESFHLEIDVDPVNGGKAKDVYLKVDGDDGVYTQTFGPWDFVGNTDADKRTIGPFKQESFDNTPRLLSFEVTAENTLGSDSYSEDIGVDGDDYGAVIQSFEAVDFTDEDLDGYYESFYLEVDVDNKTDVYLDEVFVFIKQGGATLDQTGFTFVDGIGPDDTFRFGPFNYTDFSSGTSNLTFAVEVNQFYGDVTESIQVPVDGELTPDSAPVIAGASVINTVDANGNGFYESFSIQLTVNPSNGQLSKGVSVQVNADNGKAIITEGPFNLTGVSLSDNTILIPFNKSQFDNTPRTLDFTITASNTSGSDSEILQINTDGDDYDPVIASVSLVNGTDADNDSYYESFSLEVDVNNSSPATVNAVYIEVLDGTNLLGKDGPFSFTGTINSDKQTMGPFTLAQFGNIQQTKQLTVKAYNANAEDAMNINVKIDDVAGSAPVAAFTSDKTGGTAPLTVTFTDLSLNSPTSWSWEFTGGTPSVSTDPNPVVVYNSPGVFPVTLTVSNTIGSSTLPVSGYITVTSPSLSSDATLKSLSLSEGSLDPAFAPSTYNYTVLLPEGTTEAPAVTAETTDPLATFSINDPADITSTNATDRQATLVVTAEDGSTQLEYRIEYNVEVSVSTDATLISLLLSYGSMTPAFSPNIYQYNVELPSYLTETGPIIATPADINSEVEITYPANLSSENAADRTAIIVVTAGDGQTSLTYTLIFTRKPSTMHTLSFTLSQPEELKAYAGFDEEVKPGEEVTLGGQILATGGVTPYQYSWLDSDGLLSNDKNPTLEITKEEDFVLMVNDSRGCSAYDTISITLEYGVGLDPDWAGRMLVFPNPAQERITIQFERVMEKDTPVRIFDLQSRMISNTLIEENESEVSIELSGFTPGVYLLKIGETDSEITRKIIINKK